MIAKISTGAKPSGAVGYNEKKVAFGDAQFLGGYNHIALERETVTIKDKIDVLEDYAQTNPRISKPTFHVALSFHPDEKLSDDTLKEIGQEYMERMGYATQPYLMYRHTDTLHPHMHIVSVSVDGFGKKIPDSHEKRRSNTTRKELEIEYKLVKAEDIRSGLSLNATLSPDAIHYGKQQTKQAIGNVLQTALKDYSFSDNGDLSLFLASYNIQLNRLRGERVVGGETKPWSGVTFQLTNGTEPVSPAIKASSFACAPTEKLLAKRFESGAKKNARHQPALLNRIDAGRSQYATLTEATFLNTLRAADIRVVDTGKQYLYIDEKRRSVFSEKSLPPAYHKSVLQNQFGTEDRRMPIPTISPAVAPVVLPTSQLPPQPTITSTRPPAPVGQPTTTTAPSVRLPEIRTPEPLSHAERVALGKLVSRHYQDYKKENQITYESQLIRQFPFAALQQRMIDSGQPAGESQVALREFERYKTGELPTIETRETDYFQQTSQALLALSSTMPLASASRFQFLKRMGLDLFKRASAQTSENPDGLVLQSQEQPAYCIPISPLMRGQLTGAALPDKTIRQVDYPLPFSQQEKQLYLALAREKPVPAAVTYDTVVYSQLRAGLSPERLEAVSRALNANTVKKVGGQLNEQSPVLTLTPAALGAAFAENKLSISVAGTGFVAGHAGSPPATHAPLPAALNQLLIANGLLSTASPLVTTANAPVRVLPNRDEQLRVNLLSYDVLSADYRAFLVKANVVYESALLAQPGKLPMTRLMNTLREQAPTFPGPPLEEIDLRGQVQAFIESRVKLTDTLIDAEQKQFSQRADHYLKLLSHEAITPQVRLKLLDSVGIELIESGPGKQFMVDKLRPGVSMLLSTGQQSLLKKEMPAGTENAVTVAGNAISFDERACYERNFKPVHPALMTNPGENKSGRLPAFETVNGARLKTLLSPGEWKDISGELNRNSVSKLLQSLNTAAQKDSASNQSVPGNLSRQLRQHGYLVAPGADNKTVRIGHYLTPPDRWHRVPAQNYPALLTTPGLMTTGKELKQAVTNLGSERGQATIRLANALRTGNEKQLPGIVQHITNQAAELGPFADNPAELLSQLSQTAGLLRPEKEPAQKAEGSDLKAIVRELTQASNQPGLLDLLGSSMDTSQEGKKTKMPEEIKRRVPRR